MIRPLFFAKNIIQSLYPIKKNLFQGDIHIREALNWLQRAQKMTSDGAGVSAGFHLYHGWLPPYPETTGYIIETFFAAHDKFKDQQYLQCGLKMAEWLLKIQNEDGSISDMSFSKKMVFDTGQVVFGFISAFKKTGDEKYLHAAEKAGKWLIDVQDEEGSWTKHAVANSPHTYYSRVAWSLLRLYELVKQDSYLDACRKNIDWCLRQQQNNGWFNKASFHPNKDQYPFTHTIAYTLRGIFETGSYLMDRRYLVAVSKALNNISAKILRNGFVPGTFDSDWNGNSKFTCLTGNAQLAITFFKMGRFEKNDAYVTVSNSILNYLKISQNITTGNLNIRGAIAGSYPIWGDYIHYNYPNWATKFFIDALMLGDK